MFKNYYQLTKPGIIYGNAITMLAGFFLASSAQINWLMLAATLLGQSAVIASGCVINNIVDVDIDAKMERTRKRAMVAGLIAKKHAYGFALILLIFGVVLLGLFANFLAAGVALFGFLVYVFVYTPLKRKTVHATLIGAFAGATPPVIGYVAVVNQLPLVALILYAILFLWQIPHFYSIAIYRMEDYRAARIPVFPLAYSIRLAKIYIIIYIFIFALIASLLFYYKFTGWTYEIVLILLCSYWIWKGIMGFGLVNDRLWARKMFRFSLFTLMLIAITVSLNSVLK